MTDEDWMQRAIEVARQGGLYRRERSIGSIIVINDDDIASENSSFTDCLYISTHSEMMVINSACQHVGGLELHGATLYSTLRPCVLCIVAAKLSRVSKIVYGVERSYLDKTDDEAYRNIAPPMGLDIFPDAIEIVGGIAQSDCSALYRLCNSDL